MLRPILSAMSRNKTGAVLVALQIAIALAVIINAVFIVNQRLAFIHRDSGMDVDNMIAVWSFGFAEDYDHQATIQADLDLLRSMPGVKSATPTRGVPLSGSGSATGFSNNAADEGENISANYYTMDETLIDTLGIELAAGRNFRPEEIDRLTDSSSYDPAVVLVTKDFASKLFPDTTDYVGKLIYDEPNKPIEIVGVIERMHGAWIGWDDLGNVAIYPVIANGPHVRYLINVESDKVASLVPQIEDALAASNTTRIINQVRTMTEVAGRSYSRDRGMAVALMVVITMLIVVTALGIVGLAAFNVRQRTKQIGTRRAVGARRADILRYFLAENWLMTTGGVIVGVVLTMLLNQYLATEYSLEKLDPVYVPVGILAMWGLGLVAVFWPARRASLISPAVATRTV